MLNDAHARTQAIDPNHSFIVQAPAGSGKTELLTQRFLNLLTQVDAPEQVVALTFTRKAASEMRARLLLTLHACAEATETRLQPATLERAQAVLARDKTLNWNLLQQPHRLRVMTIDALCQSILRYMPLQSDFVATAQVDVYPERLYLEAAHATLASALTDVTLQPLLITLLRHLDNQQDKLIKLWVALLQARDQWLGMILQAKTLPRAHMEETLHHIQTHVLSRLTQALPLQQQATLHQFCLQLVNLSTMPAWGECLKSWTCFSDITLAQAKALAKILLTSQQTMRKRADHHVGLKKEACTAVTYQTLKAESEELFEQIGVSETFIEALIHAIYLPQPEYGDRQWEILQALFTLLLQLVAHLKVVFQTRKRVDFIEISSCALNALGDEDEPTDLGLYFDHAIQHLLIDEFQDTSITQFELIRRLTAGWEPHDGRTLFIVGDPMQSIYRFRQAEVGLFLKIKQEGLGLLQLTPLALTSNFRSTPQLVEWVNQHIGPVFPLQEEMEMGAISFHPSLAARQDLPCGQVLTQFASSPVEEAALTVSLLQAQLNDHPDETIAILVRSRKQLEVIIPALQAANLPFEGVDLFSLADVAYLRDIYSLTQALLMPAARLPWLCVLRGPYVGLSLEDLHGVAMCSEKGSIYANLDKACKSPEISESGRVRLNHAHQIFQAAFALQDQFQLSEWVLRVQLQKMGQALIDDYARQDLEHYFEMLDQFSEQHLITDWLLFESYFRRIYSTKASVARLKIMTIHQSKGLEFDAVLMPGLGSMTRKSDPRLLRWTSVIQTHAEKRWLLSPLKAQEESSDPLYDYLGRLEDEKERYERQRVLYVGVTRAKKRLFLLDSRENAYAGSFRSGLKTVVFEERTVQAEAATAINRAATVREWIPLTDPLPHGRGSVDRGDGQVDRGGDSDKYLHRLTLDAYLINRHNHLLPGSEKPKLAIETPARRLGILAHRWIQRICQSQIKSLADLPWAMIEKEGEQAGFIGEENKAVMQTLRTQLQQLFDMPRGQWLIDAHPDAESEYAFCVTQGDKTSTYIVDRMFNIEGQRWIIDFKTGLDDESSEDKHREQVSRYAHYLKIHFQTPVRCGLYYLSSNRWVEWVEDVT